MRRKSQARIKRDRSGPEVYPADEGLRPYPAGDFDLDEETDEPTYELALNWMSAVERPSISLDIWARGNYARRLIKSRQENRAPLQVAVSSVEQMRWAHRRLALLGVPVDFIYCGGCRPRSALHLYPKTGTLDCGTGYVGTIGDTIRSAGRDWYPVWGEGRYLPAEAATFLLEEVPRAFVAGRVLVAPAEVLGIDPRLPVEMTSRLASVTRGGAMLPLTARGAEELMLNLELPYLDNLSSRDFESFLDDHEGDLVPFQLAFREACTAAQGEGNVSAATERMRQEIAALMRSEKYGQMRKTLTRVGAVFGTVGAYLAAAATMDATPVQTAIATATAAGAGIMALWNQRIESAKALSERPFSILWRLGVTRPSLLVTSRSVHPVKVPRLTPRQMFADGCHHWLGRPGIPFTFLAVRKKPGE